MMKVRFWGTRGSIATPGSSTTRYGGNTSCVELRTGSHIVIFDAGTGIRELGDQLLKEFPTQPLTIHVFISHTHWDHIQGFPFFLPAYERKNTIHLYGPPGRDKSLDKILTIQMDSDYFPVELGAMSADLHVHEMREDITIDELSVRHFYLNHPALCLAYRVSDGKSSVVYATDNEPYQGTLFKHSQNAATALDFPTYLDEKFVEFLSQADLLIGEAQYTTEEYNKDKRGWGHSPVESVVRFAVQANVKKWALFHHDPHHDDSFVDGMVKEANHLTKLIDGKTECIGAREGMELTLP